MKLEENDLFSIVFYIYGLLLSISNYITAIDGFLSILIKLVSLLSLAMPLYINKDKIMKKWKK